MECKNVKGKDVCYFTLSPRVNSYRQLDRPRIRHVKCASLPVVEYVYVVISNNSSLVLITVSP
jgi:hypothetical protein